MGKTTGQVIQIQPFLDSTTITLAKRGRAPGTTRINTVDPVVVAEATYALQCGLSVQIRTPRVPRRRPGCDWPEGWR